MHHRSCGQISHRPDTVEKSQSDIMESKKLGTAPHCTPAQQSITFVTEKCTNQNQSSSGISGDARNVPNSLPGGARG